MLLEMTRPVQGGLRQERKLEGVSNNLANVETGGYKRDVISFDRKFKARINKDFSQGDVVRTGNPLNIAIAGEGFFKVETPEGIQYTRNGNFNLNGDGIIVDHSGNPVLGTGGPVLISGDAGEGNLLINEAGDIEMGGTIVGTLDIITFNDLQKMKREAGNLLSYGGDTRDERPPAQVVLKQGFVENSNVVVVQEMARMIDYHRMFETFTKSMMTFDEVDNKAINDVGIPR